MASKRSRINRRDFLRVAAIGAGSVAGARLLSACTPKSPATAAGSTVPALQATTTTVATPVPTAAAAMTPAGIIKIYPNGPSRVVRTHHAGVWQDKALDQATLRLMLDASITKLTGLEDARSAWAALFKPGEKIAIKVNAFSNSLIWTHVPLVMEVTRSLQDAGIAPEQITIFDYRSVELTRAGFSVNTDQAGVRCYGMDSNFSKDVTQVMTKKINLSNILKESDALINMPVLKSHMLSGLSFAMKNHYGSIYYPDLLHSAEMREIAALNAIPEIKNKTRLIIGDALSANLRYANSYPYWREDWIGDSIFMSFDPVAHDAMGLKLLTSELEKAGGSSTGLTAMATPYLSYATELGIGTQHEENIEFIEQTLNSEP